MQPTPLASPTPDVPGFQFTKENLPRLDGSTANIPLGQAVVAALLGISYDEAESYINFNGTTAAYQKLVAGDCDLLLVYEAPPELKTELDGLEIVPIGRDALVFLTNIRNPVVNLSVSQIQDIYSGSITNWKDVGGENVTIKAYQRNATAGSQTMMRKLVMGDIPLADPEPALVAGGMGDLVEAVASYSNYNSAIGYNVYYYVTEMKNDPNINILSVDGIAPSNHSIQAGDYPFVNDFFVAIRKDEPEDSPPRILFDWIQSAQGQDLLEAAGYARNAKPQ